MDCGFTLEEVVMYSSRMFVATYKTIQCQSPENDNPHFLHHKNLKNDHAFCSIAIITFSGHQQYQNF